MPETAIARLLADLVGRLPAITPALGLYAAGSLGTTDFQATHSDLDLVAVLLDPADEGQLEGLTRMHKELSSEHPAGARVQCRYVARADLPALDRTSPAWAHGRMTRRRFDAIMRAELHDHGVVLAGSPVAEIIPYVTLQELARDVRSELTQVWAPAANSRLRWFHDNWVEIGLTVLPRAEAALTEGELLTKAEAIGRLGDYSVPAWVRTDLLARRRGVPHHLTAYDRWRRAEIARNAVRHGVPRLLELAGPVDP